MKPSKLILISASILALSACSTIDNVVDSVSSISIPGASASSNNAEAFVLKGNCPETEIVKELAGYSEFTSQQTASEEQLVSRSHITKIESTCAINERSMTVDLKLKFKGAAGPMARAKSGDQANHAYPFFVAITAPNGEILAKEVFSAAMHFAPGEHVKDYEETLRQIIPLSNPDQSKRHKILVGFQLDQQQLEYNRTILEQQKLLEEAAKQAEMQQKQISTQVQPAAPITTNDPIVIERISTP